MIPEMLKTSPLPRSAQLTSMLAVLMSFTGAAQAESFYRLESAVTLKSAAPSWDYVTLDQTRSRLFIGRRGDGVAVYDIKTNKLASTLDQSEEGNAIILAEPFNRGYTANEDGTSTVFELSTLKTIDRIKLGEAADSGTFDPVSGQVLITMSDEQKVLFLDARTGKQNGALALESKKYDGIAADGKGHVFVAQRDRNSLAFIDTKSRTLTAEWPLTGCEEPTGLAYDAGNQRVFVGCRGKSPVLAVVDATNGKVVATHEIGRGNDGVIYDKDTRKVYTANGVDANLVIYNQVDANTYTLAEAVTTRPYARTIAIDRTTKKIYTVTAEGTVDPSKKVNRGPAPFYPNAYHADTFVVLTYASR
jgi:hypothetical protein